MSKPLNLDIENTADTLPMDEIRHSIGNAFMQFDLKIARRDAMPIERGMLKTMFEYFSADPEQRTGQNVHDVTCYLHFAFARDGEPWSSPPETYDWHLIERLTETQIAATIWLYAMMCSLYYETNDAESVGNVIAAGLVRMGALAQMQRYREQRRRGAESKHARDGRHVAMQAIFADFERWRSGAARYRNDADFAKKMHANHASVITNEGSIKNAVARWRKDRKISC